MAKSQQRSRCRPQITIKLGSQNDSVIVDGQEFDRSKLSRAERNTVRRIVVAALFPTTNQ